MTKRTAGKIGSLLALTLMALLTGCATTVKITSDPPGVPAYIRGSGRASYRWDYLGATPVECSRSYNAVLTKVVWPNGVQSEEKRASLIGENEVLVHFQQKAGTLAPEAR
jgi:hypothetical protein